MVFQPTNLDEFVNAVVSIKKYMSPRLRLIIIDDFHYFLRDYRGKSTKNVIINNRVFALCLSYLSTLTSESRNIIGITYENPLKPNYPLSDKLINYYNCEIFQIINYRDGNYNIIHNYDNKLMLKDQY